MQYEGRTLTVLTCQDGRISSFNVTVEAGRVKFVTGELTAYAILDDSYQIIAYHGQYTLFGGRLVPLAEGTFQDVKPIHWYFGAVAYMHAMKIMAGGSRKPVRPARYCYQEHAGSHALPPGGKSQSLRQQQFC